MSSDLGTNVLPACTVLDLGYIEIDRLVYVFPVTVHANLNDTGREEVVAPVGDGWLGEGRGGAVEGILDKACDWSSRLWQSGPENVFTRMRIPLASLPTPQPNRFRVVIIGQP